MDSIEITTFLAVFTTIAALLTIAASLSSSRKQIESTKEIAVAQILAAKEQVSREIAATVLSANRQAWINDLRNTIANFIVSVYQLKLFLTQHPDERDFESMSKATSEAWLHLSRLKLLVNPNEQDHKELIVLSHVFFDSVKDRSIDEKLVERDLMIKGQIILKREWERVKSLT